MISNSVTHLRSYTNSADVYVSPRRAQTSPHRVPTLFGKSTHICMISNSVTHLRSYTNSAIADIAGNSAPMSPETPRRCRRKLRASADVSASSADIASNGECFVMSHNVLRLFHDVSQCFKSVS